MSQTSPASALTTPLGRRVERDGDLLRADGEPGRIAAARRRLPVSTTIGAPPRGGLHVRRPVRRCRHAAFEQVDVADEVGDVARIRLLVDLGGRGDLDDLAVVHDRDAVGDRHRLFLVVGDDQEGQAELLLQVGQLELGLLAQLLVERAERLVEEQHLRLLGERAGERDALALAAGQLMRLALGEGRELDQRQHLLDAAVDLGLRHAVLLEAEGDVRLDASCAGTARRTGTSCWSGAGRAGRRRGPGRRARTSPVGRLLEAGDHAHQRGLAAAGRAEQREELALVDARGRGRRRR